MRFVCIHLASLALESAFAAFCFDSKTEPKLNPNPNPKLKPRLQLKPRTRPKTLGLAVTTPVTTSGRLCAVKDRVRGRVALVDVSKGARRLGVIPGMSEAEARLRSAELIVRPRSRAREAAFLERGAELLLAFGPDAEIAPPDFLFVEISRSRGAIAHRFKDVDTNTEEAIAKMIHRSFADFGHDVSVVVAQDPETARAFSTFLSRQRWMSWSRNVAGTEPKKRETWVVASDETQRALFGLPLETLAFTEAAEDPEGSLREKLIAVVASLKILGVHDVMRFHDLPRAQITARFGAVGALLMRRARAECVRPLRRFEPKSLLIESYEVDPPLDGVEPMLFVLRRLFSNLERRLEARALSSGALEIRFTVLPENVSKGSSSRSVETIQIAFARPTRRAKTMLSLAKERLSGSRVLLGAVVHVDVEMIASAPDHGAQLDLFTAYETRVEALSELMGRLQAMLKEGEIFAPKISSTHRPESAWDRGVFDVEGAIRSSADDRSSDSSKAVSSMSCVLPLSSSKSSSATSTFTLPKMHDLLSVSEDVANDGQRTSPWSAEAQERWPKPVSDHQAEAFVVALPPRPLELLMRPEPIVWVRKRGQEHERFFWRGESIEIAGFSARECFETEWWTSVPLIREYVVAEALDGRRFWIFWASDGEAFVQGIFD
ncbi:MAG: hypothetical protein IPK13_15345 [Deltaproteobacteria bacterium]|nr:hypothetical protein [Deltaproteobacteria bacterium]